MNKKTSHPKTARSLATTLTVTFITLSVVILLINGSITLYANVRAYQDSIATQQQLVAADAGKAVSTFIQEKFNTLQTAVDFADPIKASPEERETFVDGLLGSHPSFQQFVLLNKQGRVLADTYGIGGASSQQFTNHLDAASDQTFAGNNYLSPVYIDDITSEPLITIAIPVKNVFGDTEGSLIAEVNLKFIWSLVEQLKVGETGYVYVVDNLGNLIAFEDTTRVLAGENVSQVHEVKEFIENPDDTEDITPEAASYTGLTGTAVLGTYVPLGTPPWAVLIEQPITEAYATIYRSVALTAGTILLMAVLAGIAGTMIARRLAVPVIDLTDVATRIADGELQLQATATGAQEVVTLAVAFNKMTSQLRDLITSLEQRVTTRTRDLEIVTEVSTATATILESTRLLQEVVDLTKERFNLYHSHIYLLDEKGENLVLTAGAGEPGHAMVAQGHSIPLDREQSLVARAARERKGVTVNDVTQATDFLPNPLLPDTHSELAVPMIVGGNVIGVFDIQSEQVGRFTDADVNIQTTLAAQLATSIQNVRFFEQSRRQAELESVVNVIGQKIQRSTSIEETLQTAIRELGTAIGASRVKIGIGENTRHNGGEGTNS